MATVPTLNDIIKAITESLKVCRRFFKVFFPEMFYKHLYSKE